MNILQAQTSCDTSPMRAFACGAAAGFAASLLMSGLARVLPGMGMDPKLGDRKQKGRVPPPPEDPFNPAQVREWQQHSQAPAVFSPQATQVKERPARPQVVAPAAVLVQP